MVEVERGCACSASFHSTIVSQIAVCALTWATWRSPHATVRDRRPGRLSWAGKRTFIGTARSSARAASVRSDKALARHRTLRRYLIDPTIAVHNGRIVKRTGGRRSEALL